jgi:hypothetical protein
MTIDDHLKEIKRLTEKYRQSYEDEAPKFNGKQCKNGCNCAEIAEYINNQQPVKSYQCLGINDSLSSKSNSNNNIKDFIKTK